MEQPYTKLAHCDLRKFVHEVSYDVTRLIEPKSDERRTGGYRYNKNVCDGTDVTIERVSVASPERYDEAARGSDTAVIDSLLVFDIGYRSKLAEKLNGAVRIGMIHYLPSDSPFLTIPARRKMRASEAESLSLLAGCIVPSVYLANTLRSSLRFRRPIVVVHPGIDKQFIEAKQLREWPIRRIVTVGSVTPGKGILYGLSALNRLASHRWTWSIIGPCDAQSEYTRMIARKIDRFGLVEKVRFAGALDTAGVCKELVRADLYLSPSLQEAYGMAGAEAIAAGLPVAGFAVGGFREALGRRKNSFLTSEKSPMALSRILSSLFTSKSKFSTIARGAFDSDSSRTWDVVANEFRDAISRIRSETKREKLI